MIADGRRLVDDENVFGRQFGARLRTGLDSRVVFGVELRQANRLLRQGGSIARDELARIDAADIRQSRVFQGGIDQ